MKVAHENPYIISTRSPEAHTVSNSGFDKSYLRVDENGAITLTGLQPGEVYMVQVSHYDELMATGHA